jgi:hypothetical protein
MQYSKANKELGLNNDCATPIDSYATTWKSLSTNQNRKKCLPCTYMNNILQHPTSHPTTISAHTTIFNTMKTNISPNPVGQHGILTKCCTQRRHHANVGKGLLAEQTVLVVGALCDRRSEEILG